MSLCSGCFEEKGEQEVCSRCGYDESQERSSLLLPHGTVLRGQYVIGRVLGKPGGFGITYLGYNQKLQIKVAIKEYLPREIVGRKVDGLTIGVHSTKDEENFRFGIDHFLQEARLLAKFDHPNIVRVLDFFEENGTAYLVMDYYHGVSLVEHLEQHGGRLGEQAVLAIMMPVLEGLREVHACGVLHRDIKPQNIYVTDTGRPILLDFGAARQTIEEISRSMSVIMTPGFAPYEQYHKRGRQGPWTDVYGCAATMYYLLTGQVPADAIERMAQDNFTLPPELEQTLSSGMRTALTRALALLPENRLQNVQEFQSIILNETIKLSKNQLSATQVMPPAALAQQAAESDRGMTAGNSRPFYKRTSGIVAIVMVVLLLLSGGGYWYYQHTQNPVTQLHKKGIDFTEDAFFHAVKADDQDTVKLFLAAGMLVNQAQSSTGETPIMTAIEAGQLPMVKLLIASGADLNVKDAQGRSLLDLALKQGNTQILKLLMDQLKVTVDGKDERGKTLLEKAIALGNIATVKFLMDQGANINAMDADESTLLDRALADGNQQIVAVLKNAGAKRNVNKKFKSGQLNEISLPYSKTGSFEVDLLGDGIGQRISINNYEFFKSTVAIAQEGRQFTSFGIYGSLYTWYVAYLRDDNVPDLVYFYRAGSGGFVNDFKIIGKTGKDSIGVIFDPGLSVLGYTGISGRAGISIDGKRLILTSGSRKASVEWDAQHQYFQMKPLN